MRLWVILLLLVISTVVAKKPRGEKPKVTTDDLSKDEDVPPLGDDTDPEGEDSTEEIQTKTKDVRKKLIEKKNTADEGDPLFDETQDVIMDKLDSLNYFRQQTGIDPVTGKSDDDDDAKPAKSNKPGKVQGSKETAKTTKKPSRGRKPAKVEEFNYEDEDDLEHDTSVCDSARNEPCTCEGTVIKCENILFKDRLPLSTADLDISNTSFVPFTASFKGNAITLLKKGKILPGHEDQINEIDFSHNKIMHIEPGTISLLTNCSKLHLSHNLLKNVRKSWFDKSKSVHQLFLDNNKITTIDDGAFSGLNLTKLVLDGNNILLTKEMFAGLDNLESLSLDNCNLDDNMEVNVFDNLPNLKTLSLIGNPFTAVPKAIQALSTLVNLDLSKTNIAELHEDSLKDDHILESIVMENMPYLYSIHSCTFCGLQKLKIVEMNNNTALYHLDANAFGNDEGKVERKVTSVTVLHIENNNLTTISQSLLNWNAITSLAIGNNPINCSCDNAYLLGGKMFKFDNRNIVPVCKYPPTLKGKPLAKVSQHEACDTIKAVETTSRAVTFLSVLMVGCFFCVGMYVFYSSGRMNAFIGRVRDARNNFPAMSYANLSNTDEGRSLEQDFQPRPEEV